MKPSNIYYSLVNDLKETMNKLKYLLEVQPDDLNTSIGLHIIDIKNILSILVSVSDREYYNRLVIYLSQKVYDYRYELFKYFKDQDILNHIEKMVNILDTPVFTTH